MTGSRRVSYFYDAEIGNYHYGQGRFGLRSGYCIIGSLLVHWYTIHNHDEVNRTYTNIHALF